MNWYEEKDMNNEVVKDYMFMGGNENPRSDTVKTVSGLVFSFPHINT